MGHKGYQATIERDEETGWRPGEVVGLRDGITFQGASADELQVALRDSVEDYLEFCRERGEEQTRPN